MLLVVKAWRKAIGASGRLRSDLAAVRGGLRGEPDSEEEEDSSEVSSSSESVC